jgi:hypothetical protein
VGKCQCKPSEHFPEFPEILEFVSGKHPKLREFHPYTLLQLETQKPLTSGFPGVPRDIWISGFWDISGISGKPSRHFPGFRYFGFPELKTVGVFFSAQATST